MIKGQRPILNHFPDLKTRPNGPLFCDLVGKFFFYPLNKKNNKKISLLNKKDRKRIEIYGFKLRGIGARIEDAVAVFRVFSKEGVLEKKMKYISYSDLLLRTGYYEQVKRWKKAEKEQEKNRKRKQNKRR